jgi:hypothetical protein
MDQHAQATGIGEERSGGGTSKDDRFAGGELAVHQKHPARQSRKHDYRHESKVTAMGKIYSFFRVAGTFLRDTLGCSAGSTVV